MIIEGLFGLIFTFVEFVLELMPSFDMTANDYTTGTITLVANALVLFPIDLWILLVVNIVFFLTASLAWAVIEWVYKKIPGVD